MPGAAADFKAGRWQRHARAGTLLFELRVPLVLLLTAANLVLLLVLLLVRCCSPQPHAQASSALAEARQLTEEVHPDPCCSHEFLT